MSKKQEGVFEIPKEIQKLVTSQEDYNGHPDELIVFIHQELKSHPFYFAVVHLNVKWIAYSNLEALQQGIMTEDDWPKYKPGSKDEKEWKRDHFVQESALVLRYARQFYVFPSPEVAQTVYNHMLENSKSKQ